MLDPQIKLLVLNTIISKPDFLGKYGEHDNILTFLLKIWNLKEMPSEDGRFKNAYDDAFQHLINNDDWPLEYLFVERFDLINGDEKHFILFIESVVNPTVRTSKEDILTYVSMINSIIEPSGFRLILSSYFEELPVFKYREYMGSNELPLEIQSNLIPIYLVGSEKEFKYPCFKIETDSWDDYGYKTSFNLIFCSQKGTSIRIGRTKIMKLGTKTTLDSLSSYFTDLGAEYCSLGQSSHYYTNLKEALGPMYISFLLAIRDVAIFPRIYEVFEDDEIFKISLTRGNDMERLARNIRFEIEGVASNEYFKFNYSCKPPFADNPIVLNFDFEYNSDFEHRIYAIIGKNGTGKTRILSSLARELSEKEPKSFTPRKPVYGKIFTVSYSFFDRFEIPARDVSFNYVYCGLKKAGDQWKTEYELMESFYKSAFLIKQKNLENVWYEILSNFIDTDVLEKAFDKIPGFINDFDYSFVQSSFSEVKGLLSSGQSITLYMISEILSQIRYDSLILFDEPETHLHPNAITALVNTLFDLVNKFESFCVIATHSPLIIQEIPARNIFVIERENNEVYVRGLERESLGENLTVITQDIFGNRDVPRHFINIISTLVSKGKSYEDIIKLLETDNLPVTSNIRLYIKAIMKSSL